MPGPRVIVVMGVAGSGKTTVGEALARELDWPFHDADRFHSAENRARMGRGEPLTDADRRPWLKRLRVLVRDVLWRGETAVLACSALKQAYRDALIPAAAEPGEVAFVYLHAPQAELRARLGRRDGHFAKADLLESQLAALEEPADAVRIDGEMPPARIVASIRQALAI